MITFVEVTLPESRNGSRGNQLREYDEWCKNYYREFKNGDPRSGWSRKMITNNVLEYRFMYDDQMAMLFKLRFGGT